jgi:hypothetical protein
MLLLFVGCAGSSFLLTRTVDHRLRRLPVASPVTADTTQLVMVYFGKRTCAWSNRPEVPQLINRITEQLQAKARNQHLHFITVGVALDWTANDGIKYLSRFRAFNEVSAGNSWSNGYALKYLEDEHPGQASTPEIVLIRRRVRIPTAGHPNYGVDAGEQVVARKVGLLEITRWASQGAPFADWQTANVAMFNPITR